MYITTLMQVIFITRFSILDPGVKSFRITNRNKHDKDSVENELFSPERMESKFNYFEKITLPSILNQSGKNWTWYIVTSTYLPTNYLERLKSLCHRNNRIKIFKVDNFVQFGQVVNNQLKKINPANYATVRLDDDDGLNRNFVQIVQKYKNSRGKIISFPLGKKIRLVKNGNKLKLNIGHRQRQKNCAFGLTAIGHNIYKCGNHVTVHKRFKVIYDFTPDMYQVTCDPSCDTGRTFK